MLALRRMLRTQHHSPLLPQIPLSFLFNYLSFLYRFLFGHEAVNMTNELHVAPDSTAPGTYLRHAARQHPAWHAAHTSTHMCVRNFQIWREELRRVFLVTGMQRTPFITLNHVR
jgi:hypothetical protein